MAITNTALAGALSTVDGTSWNSASITPTGNTVVIAAFASRRAGSAPSDAHTISGNGLTWTKIVSGAGTRVRITLWWGIAASPTTGVITFGSGETNTHAAWSVSEFPGANITTPIVQSPAASTGTNTTVTITLSAFGSADNAAFGFFNHFANEVTTEGTGFTEIHDNTTAENTQAYQTEWKLNDATVDASWATSSEYVALALEIGAAAAAVTTRRYSLPLTGVG